MPKTGDWCDRSGNYIDEHGCQTPVQEGQMFPTCADGETWWWHEDLPVAVHMKWEAARREENRRRGIRQR